ncbi:hypothetical protein ABZY36_36175 [Streptomyces sp. NPDC006627]|uniref:hypothetical protein n=1 Tax=Streptomyces sp. NPDC006627 TaxID=3154679 RepID=UPI0033A368FA
MNLDEIPYTRRKLLAVEAGISLKDTTGKDCAIAATSLVPAVGQPVAGWQWHRRRSLGITTVTVQAAKDVFDFPDGHPVSGTVYAAHPHDHTS